MIKALVTALMVAGAVSVSMTDSALAKSVNSSNAAAAKNLQAMINSTASHLIVHVPGTMTLFLWQQVCAEMAGDEVYYGSTRSCRLPSGTEIECNFEGDCNIITH